MKNKILVILFLVFVASFLRLNNSGGNAVFYYDESYDALQARRMIVDKKVTLLGHPYSISGTYQGPLYYHMIAPILAVSRYDPESVVYFITSINILALLVIWFFSKKFFGHKTAFFISLLFVISPKLVEFSQKSWYPGPIELFSPLAFFLLILSEKNNKLLFTVFSGLLAGFMLQLHIMSFPFVIFAVVYLFFTKRKVDIFVFIAGTVLGVLPMIIFELRHEFFNIKMFLKFLNTNSALTTYPTYLERLLVNFKVLLGGYFGGDKNSWILTLSIMAFLAGGVMFYRKNNKIAKSVFVFFFSSLLLASVFKGEVAFHYLTFLHFVPLIFIGFFIKNIARNTFVKVFLFSGFVAIIYLYSSNRLYIKPEWTIEKSRKVGKIIAHDVKVGEKFNVVLLVHGESRAWPLRYFLDTYKKPPLGVDDYGKSKMIYVVSNDLKLVKTINLWELRAGGPLKVEKKWQLDSGYDLYKLRYINL